MADIIATAAYCILTSADLGWAFYLLPPPPEIFPAAVGGMHSDGPPFVEEEAETQGEDLTCPGHACEPPGILGAKMTNTLNSSSQCQAQDEG